ncbi:SDR family oxidoreductase [Limosilactobacillus fermentum]
MQTVVITGATSGIGLATTKKFLQNGWQVMLVARNATKGAQVVADLTQDFDEKLIGFVAADVSKEAYTKEMAKATLERFGGIDALVNDAGIVVHGKVHEISADDWAKVFDINVKGSYLAAKAVLPTMLDQRHGAIVNISSVSGMGGDYGMVAYNATKGAIINMTRAMAIDYGEDQIRVNSVAPGPTNTPMFPQDMKGTFAKNSPLNRIVEPEEVANAVYFLSTDEASAITGETLPVTAGFEISTGQPKQV